MLQAWGNRFETAAESMTPEQRAKDARKAGLVGGGARTKKLSKRRRKEIARNAGEARLGGKEEEWITTEVNPWAETRS
jgi:hypothetical protein